MKLIIILLISANLYAESCNQLLTRYKDNISKANIAIHNKKFRVYDTYFNKAKLAYLKASSECVRIPYRYKLSIHNQLKIDKNIKSKYSLTEE